MKKINYLYLLIILLLIITCENSNEKELFLNLAIYPAGYQVKTPSDAFRVIDHLTIIIKINERGMYNIKCGIEREKTIKLTDKQIKEVEEAIKVLNKVDIDTDIYVTGGCKISFQTKKRFETFNDFIIHHYDENDYNKELDEAIETIFSFSPIKIESRCQY